METEALPVGNEAVTKADEGKLTQKEAVFKFINEYLSSKGLALDNQIKTLLGTKKKDLQGEDAVMIKDLKSTVRTRLLAGLENGSVSVNPDAKTPPRKYSSGLVNNWIRKDKRYKLSEAE